jgi:methionine-rich copper-binding protein CopC
MRSGHRVLLAVWLFAGPAMFPMAHSAIAHAILLESSPSANAAVATLTSQAQALNPGEYRIRWQVLASDGHITRGEIPFQVTQP